MLKIIFQIYGNIIEMDEFYSIQRFAILAVLRLIPHPLLYKQRRGDFSPSLMLERDYRVSFVE
jgi:hypothetical protein